MGKTRFSYGLVAILIGLIFVANGEKRIYAGEAENSVIIAGIILKWVPKNLEKNYQRFESLVRQAAAQGAKIICSSECFLDGYSARDTSLSNQEFIRYTENVNNGRYTTKMRKLCRELKIYLIAGISEASRGKVYISALLIGPNGNIIGTYRKNFLWGYENDKYKPGNGYPVFASKYGKIGIMICFERQKPEVISNLKKNGAEMIFCLSGGSFGDWNDRIVSKRSAEVQLPIIFVHPVEFLVTGPQGDILSRYISGGQLDEDGTGNQAGDAKTYKLLIQDR